MSCSVKLENLSYKNGDVILSQEINLNVSHKEKIAIIGPNGSGKTTLLDIIAGLREFDGGKLELFHKNIKNLKDYTSIREMVGYLFQDSDNQFLSPIVVDDVAFSLLSSGIKKEDAYLRADMILKDLNISHLRDKIVYHLSGGEKKIVALAGVLICEPKLMLLDEPTNGLDTDTQARLAKIFKNIDKSMIIVSHHREFLESIVDKIYKITPDGLILISDP